GGAVRTLHPADPPADLPPLLRSPPGLRAQHPAGSRLVDEHVLDNQLMRQRERQFVTVKPLQQRHLLRRRDAQRPVEPEMIDAAGRILVAVMDTPKIAPFPRLPKRARKTLEHPDRRLAHRRAQRLVAVPRLALAL